MRGEVQIADAAAAARKQRAKPVNRRVIANQRRYAEHIGDRARFNRRAGERRQLVVGVRIGRIADNDGGTITRVERVAAETGPAPGIALSGCELSGSRIVVNILVNAVANPNLRS